MINRTNWRLMKAYLAYRAEVSQISEESVRLDETRLRHVLEWAGETLFKEALSIRPTLPDYLESARIDERKESLSPAYKRKVINAAHQLGTWLSIHQTGYKTSLFVWLDTLKSPRKPASQDRQHEAVTLAEIEQIAAAPAEAPWEKRIRASAVMWFLYGIRIGAFVTLPVAAIDIPTRQIRQWPELGVNTKFGKRSTTYMLKIPHLLEVVQEWDREVRRIVPDIGYWFAPLSNQTGEIKPREHLTGNNRDSRARVDLKRWLKDVGLPYHSPHKFRHGFAVYALKLAQDMADFKAISMNLMHANMSITDGIYAILSEQDISERIASLGERENSPDELAKLLRQLAIQLEGRQ